MMVPTARVWLMMSLDNFVVAKVRAVQYHVNGLGSIMYIPLLARIGCLKVIPNSNARVFGRCLRGTGCRAWDGEGGRCKEDG